MFEKTPPIQKRILTLGIHVELLFNGVYSFNLNLQAKNTY